MTKSVTSSKSMPKVSQKRVRNMHICGRKRLLTLSAHTLSLYFIFLTQMLSNCSHILTKYYIAASSLALDIEERGVENDLASAILKRIKGKREHLVFIRWSRREARLNVQLPLLFKLPLKLLIFPPGALLCACFFLTISIALVTCIRPFFTP